MFGDPVSLSMLRLLVFVLFLSFTSTAQLVPGQIFGSSGMPVPFAVLLLHPGKVPYTADAAGQFTLVNPPTTFTLELQAIGFKREVKSFAQAPKLIRIQLVPEQTNLEEVVITGNMREMAKEDSPVNIDILTPKIFQKTATPNLFEATSLVNGVRPQVNCNVCNTGDIHINGMEGPYTLILIDGMPIVSGLSSVYGLMGIPVSMMERLEVAKGPAGALYGTEAMGGTINLITKDPSRAPRFFADHFTSSYLENNLDLGASFRIGKNINCLTGANAFYYDQPFDKNKDGFTDVTLQKRLSIFNKISALMPQGKILSVAVRVVGENRWGGEMSWTPYFRGGDSIYGESILVKRTEVIGKYEWPFAEKITTQFSYNLHDQNAAYGRSSFVARQSTSFMQTFWDKAIGDRHVLLTGFSLKHVWYDDNTAVTFQPDSTGNLPESGLNSGVFLQDEITFDSDSKFKLLAGLRMDHHTIYNFIPSPRLALKWSPHYRFTTRLNLASGFRIVNVFTEDHAALTGARKVFFAEKIQPEKSYNGTLNVVFKQKGPEKSMIVWDLSLFYYHFFNKIVANYDEDPKLVIYRNLNGYAFSRGFSLNATLSTTGPLKIVTGLTYSDVQNIMQGPDGRKHASWQLNTPRWSGNIIASVDLHKSGWWADLTGNWYGPQRLAVLPGDFRPEQSPWFMLLNLQVTKAFQRFEAYGGVKNLLNFLPQYPLMRPWDPFNKLVDDPVNNPNGYTFDTAYNYAPVQGIRFYLGFRYSLAR